MLHNAITNITKTASNTAILNNHTLYYWIMDTLYPYHISIMYSNIDKSITYNNIRKWWWKRVDIASDT